jgi:hypothetical protein
MRMIRVPECRNNSSFHKLPTRLTTSPKEPMIILATVVTIITREITARSQQYTTLFTLEAVYVVMLVLYLENFTGTRAAALGAYYGHRPTMKEDIQFQPEKNLY